MIKKTLFILTLLFTLVTPQVFSMNAEEDSNKIGDFEKEFLEIVQPEAHSSYLIEVYGCFEQDRLRAISMIKNHLKRFDKNPNELSKDEKFLNKLWLDFKKILGVNPKIAKFDVGCCAKVCKKCCHIEDNFISSLYNLFNCLQAVTFCIQKGASYEQAIGFARKTTDKFVSKTTEQEHLKLLIKYVVELGIDFETVCEQVNTYGWDEAFRRLQVFENLGVEIMPFLGKLNLGDKSDSN